MRRPLRDLIRLMGVMVDLYCASYGKPPDAVTLDIDDTVDVVHGHQQLALFNAHYDERCFLPIHVYDTATSRPVAVLLRPGKTPSGIEIRGHLRRLIRRIRQHWPVTHITIRGDGHYGRPEVMDWCENNAVDYVFGLPGNATLDRAVEEAADDIRTRRALNQQPCRRGFAETRYQAKSWNRERRACARIEATTKGLDIRFVVTSLTDNTAQHIYETLYCARGQAENLIKLHKTQLASDRTSCRSPRANQRRLILHTAAYWLILAIRDTIPHTHALATVECTTIRLHLLKLGARIIETAARVRIAFAAACPDAGLFRQIATGLIRSGP
jgi:Transposase DDE domain group 1